MFHVLTGLAAIYILWRLVWRLPVSVWIKYPLTLLTIIAAEHHLVTRLFFGSMASPEIPAPLLMVLGWAFGSLLIITGLLLVLDAISLVTWLYNKPLGQRLFANITVRGVLAMLIMVITVFGVREAVRVPEIKTVHVTLPGLPPALEGLRIAQLTDLHASHLLQAPWIQQVVDRTNALHPDLIVITGDMVDGTVAARRQDVAPLAQLQARLGVYAIVGNHEYYTQYQPWIHQFREMDLNLLLNEHVVLTDKNTSFVLAGITDKSAYDFGETPPNIATALAGVSPNDFTILLSHRPSGARGNAQLGPDMQLSGHTHGGQILGMHLITQLANEGYVSGKYDVDGMLLYVSNGAGLWSGLPVRLGQRSEITEFILHAGKTHQ